MNKCASYLRAPVWSAVTYLVRVTTDRRDPLYPEIEPLDRETGRLKEGHDKAAQTAVNVQTNLVLCSKLP